MSSTQLDRLERVRSLAQRHWLGQGESEAAQKTAQELRFQFQRTAEEYRRAAITLYEDLQKSDRRFTLASRSTHLFLAYSTLWQAFEHIYRAASFSRFCGGEVERAPVEDEREQIRAVLSSPYFEPREFHGLGMLRNGETVDGALNRLLAHSSREMQDTYGEGFDQTLTDMTAYLSGQMSVDASGAPRETWTIHALDDRGAPIDPDAPITAEKYRAALVWYAFQIRHNINFTGTSAGGIDDALLIIRSFCLLEPVVATLLTDSKKKLIFSL